MLNIQIMNVIALLAERLSCTNLTLPVHMSASLQAKVPCCAQFPILHIIELTS